MSSVWSAGCACPEHGTLNGDKKTDILIIGGGLAGLLCAYLLDEAGTDYLLVEAGRVCTGVTGNTTAKITVQHGLIYRRLLREFGAEQARLYYEANAAALREYRRLGREIDCDFENRDSYVYSLTDTKKLELELAALEAIGRPAAFCRETALPFPIAGAVKLENQAQFNPLKFVAAISGGLRICENTRVTELIGRTAVTPHGRITAEKIIVATHFPFLNKHGSYFLKMFQNRSYVLALEGAGQVDGMYIDEAEGGLSFRNYGDLLLLTGGAHRTGKPHGGWRAVEAAAAQLYPAAREKYRWAAQDCMTLDGVPYIGRYSARTQGLYVITGFNKWGMTASMAGAMLLRDLVLERDNGYAALVSPSRSILRPQLAANALAAAAGMLYPTTKRCPHLGCALHWNPQEHSWDCSCHGSRFSADGELLDNPANGDLKS